MPGLSRDLARTGGSAQRSGVLVLTGSIDITESVESLVYRSCASLSQLITTSHCRTSFYQCSVAVTVLLTMMMMMMMMTVMTYWRRCCSGLIFWYLTVSALHTYWLTGGT